MEKTETKIVYICDCCNRTSSPILTKCPVCGKECCYTCSSQPYDVWHTNICKCCLAKPEINEYYMSAWKNTWGKKREKIIQEMKAKFELSPNVGEAVKRNTAADPELGGE